MNKVSYIDMIKFLVTALVPLMIAYITAKWNKRGKDVEVTSAPYDALARRVATLENQVSFFQEWAAKVIPLHSDITTRWDWYRRQDTPPSFPTMRNQVPEKEN